MTSFQSSSFTIAASILFLLLFLNAFTTAIPLSGRSTPTRTDLSCISTCLSDLSLSASSLCKGSTVDADKCLCALVTSVAPKAIFANCVESCSQDERNRLRKICGTGDGGSNDGGKKAIAGIQESDPTNFASTSGKDDDNDDDNGSDSADNDNDNDNDDDEDYKPKKTPDVPVRVNNSTNTDDTTNTSNTGNTSDGKNQDQKGDASLIVIHPAWAAIEAAAIIIVLAI